MQSPAPALGYQGSKYMTQEQINAKAAEELAEEAKRNGFRSNHSEESEEEEESEEDEEESETDEDEEEESEEESDEEEDEEEDEEPRSKKTIPVNVYNKLRKELREATALLKVKDTEMIEIKAKLPDDFEERVKAVAEEIGISDPEGLKKILDLMKSITLGEVSKVEQKLAAIEKRVEESRPQISEVFQKEWNTFEPKFLKEFPGTKTSELKQAYQLMLQLAHGKKTGGKVYIDEKGNEVLDPYELDYILYKNKDKFEEVVSGKKSHGMESGRRTQPITVEKPNTGEMKPLGINASPAEIEARDKELSGIEMSGNKLHSKGKKFV